MSIINNDGVSLKQIVMREEPPNCTDCGKVLRFSFELENDNLCSDCGPGSLRFAEKKVALFKARAAAPIGKTLAEVPTAKEFDAEVAMSSDEYITKLRIAGSDLCLKVRMVLADQPQFKDLPIHIQENLRLLFESVKEFEPLTT
jgi:hypothetical protein